MDGSIVTPAKFSPTPQGTATRALIIALIITIIGCWGGMILSTIVTYRQVAPIPAQFVNTTGKTLMTSANIVAGKAGFQKADLMDYGSLYGMGSYYGEDYTALYLVQLGQRTNAQLAMKQFNKPFAALTPEQQYSVTQTMQGDLRNINLLAPSVVLPDAGGAPINAPLVNYYEHGTFLTLNHAHTSMFGAFGLLAIGLIYLTLRYMAGNRMEWSDKLGIWAFWLYNAGVILWVVLNFFPVGWAQLVAVYSHGYAYARSLDFYNKMILWQWLRFPGDILFAIAALLMAIDFIIKTRMFWRTRSEVSAAQVDFTREF